MLRLIRYPLLALGLMATTVKAEPANELPEPRLVTLTSGVICDTREQVETLLTHISLEGQFPAEPVEGCGILRGQFPAMVQPLGWYETPAARSLVAQFTHPFTGYTQFGWIAFELNPEYTPEPADLDL